MRWNFFKTLPVLCLLALACQGVSDEVPEDTRSQEQELLSLGCSSDTQCTGGLVCQLGACVLGQCLYLPLIGCNPDDPGPGPDPDPDPDPEPEPEPIPACVIDADCPTGPECMVVRCVDEVCVYNPTVDCEPEEPDPEGCQNDAQCGDALTCTLDVCIAIGNICLNVGILGCVESGSGGSGAGGSGDSGGSGAGDSGGSGAGDSGGASSGGSSGGKSCASLLDCDDADSCTLDVCVEPLKLCAQVAIPFCTDGTGGQGSGGAGNGDGGDGSGASDSGGNGAGASSHTGGDGSGASDSGGNGAGASSNTGGAGSSDSGYTGGEASSSGSASSSGASGPQEPDGSGGGGDKPRGPAEDGEEWEIRGGACSMGSGPVDGSKPALLGVVLAALVLMRRRRVAAAVAATLLSSLAFIPSAEAQGFSTDANPTPLAPEDLLWTERPTIPMDHLSFFGRAMLRYADDPLIMKETNSGEEVALIDAQGALYLSAGLALFDRFHVAAMVPLYAQSGQALGTGLTPDGVSVGNPEAEVRVNILDLAAPFELGLAGRVAVPVGQSSQLVADRAASGGPRIMLGKSFGEEKRSFVALNAGALFREEQSLQNVDVASQLTFGGGLNLDIWRGLGLTAELQGRTPFSGAFSDGNTPLSALFGVRYAARSWSVAAGLGPGLSDGYGAPNLNALGMGGVRLNRKEEKVEELKPAPERKPKVVAKAPPEEHCASELPPEDPGACPELDADGDGIRNGSDICPLEAEDFDGFQDQDGCPESDNDGDGIPDSEDQCPMDAETINQIDDQDGCPDMIRVLDGQIRTLEPIFFETGKTIISGKSEPLLIEMARVIQARPELGVIAIDGHTDDVGSDASNLRLSQGRADSVRQFLVNAGVPPERLIATGYGESRPIAEGQSREARAMNRRVEFRFSPPANP